MLSLQSTNDTSFLARDFWTRYEFWSLMMSTEQKEEKNSQKQESAQFKELTKSIVGIALIYDVRKMWKRVKKWSLCPLQAPPTLIAHHKRSNGLNWIGPVKITGSTVTQHPDFTFRSNTKPSALSLNGNRVLAKAIIKKEKKGDII